MSIRSELGPSFYSGMILGMKSLFIMTEIKILCKMFVESFLRYLQKIKFTMKS